MDWPWPDSLDAVIAAPKHQTDSGKRARARAGYAHSRWATPCRSTRIAGRRVYYTIQGSDFVRRDQDGNVTFDSRAVAAARNGEFPRVSAAALGRERRRRGDPPDQRGAEAVEIRTGYFFGSAKTMYCPAPGGFAPANARALIPLPPATVERDVLASADLIGRGNAFGSGGKGHLPHHLAVVLVIGAQFAVGGSGDEHQPAAGHQHAAAREEAAGHRVNR